MSALRAFGWFRVIPLCLVLLFGLISFGYTSAPSLLLRPFYPLEYQDYISKASAQYSVDPYLVAAVIECESNWNSEAESYRGAQGLMQLMPATAGDLGVKDAYDPRENIMGGTKYLSQLMDMFDGDLTKTIAAYNAGPGAVQHYGGVPPYAETQGYVDKVLGYYQEGKGLA